jgi:hypothetical protein
VLAMGELGVRVARHREHRPRREILQ